MDGKELTEDLKTLHESFLEELEKRIKDGSATSGDMKLAYEMLKDNGVPTVNLTGIINELEEHADALQGLPTFEDYARKNA